MGQHVEAYRSRVTGTPAVTESPGRDPQGDSDLEVQDKKNSEGASGSADRGLRSLWLRLGSEAPGRPWAPGQPASRRGRRPPGPGRTLSDSESDPGPGPEPESQ